MNDSNEPKYWHAHISWDIYTEEYGPTLHEIFEVRGPGETVYAPSLEVAERYAAYLNGYYAVPPLDAEQIADLSPGVRDLVVALREAGFYTTDSGDGSLHRAGMECAVPFRMVAILCPPDQLAATADRLYAWLRERAEDYGLPDWGAYRATAQYNPVDGTASLMIAESDPEGLDYVERITGERPKGLW